MTIKCVDDNETWVKINYINSRRPDKIYLISDLGRLMEYDPKKEPKPFTMKVDKDEGLGRSDKDGYIEYSIGGKHFKVHRLVATYFIEDNLSSNLHVHHINGVPDDNRAVNLQWVTAQEHVAIEIGEGKRKPLNYYNPHKRKYSWKDICAMRFLHEGQGWSMNQIAGLYDMPYGSMKQILQYKSYKRP